MVCRRKQLALLDSLAHNDPAVTSIAIDGSISVNDRLIRLAQALPLARHLQTVIVDGARASPESATTLATALKANRSVQSLVIRSNLSRHDQAREVPTFWNVLLQTLANKQSSSRSSLRELLLENTALAFCMPGLTSYLSSTTTLRKLVLHLPGDSYLNAELAHELLHALRTNRSLTQVELVGGDVVTISAILKGLQSHSSLKTFTLVADAAFYPSSAIVGLTAAVQDFFLHSPQVTRYTLECPYHEALLASLVTILPTSQQITSLTVNGACPLIPKAISDMPCLQELHVTGNSLPQALVDVLTTHPKVKHLQVDGMEQAVDLQFLVGKLQTLSLGRVAPETATAMMQPLLRGLACSSLQTLELKDWPQQDACDRVVLAALGTVQRLTLVRCGCLSYHRILPFLKTARRLQELVLDGCVVPTTAISAITMHLRKWKRLELRHADLDDLAACAIFKQLGKSNSKLAVLRLEHNNGISATALMEFIKVLPQLKHLKQFGISWHASFRTIVPEWMQALSSNTSLDTIVLAEQREGESNANDWYEQLVACQHRNRMHGFLEASERMKASVKPHVLQWLAAHSEDELFDLIRNDLGPEWLLQEQQQQS